MPLWVALLLLLGIAIAATVFVLMRRATASHHGLPVPDATMATPSDHADPADIQHGSEQGGSSSLGSAADVNPEITMRSRLKLFSGATGVLFGALLIRLWGMQLISNHEYASMAEGNLTREISTKAPRGRIFDRNGNVLVGNRPCMALVADPSAVQDTRLVRRVSCLLGMPEVAVRRAIQNTSEGAQSKRTIMIDVPEAAIAYVTEHQDRFPGIEVEARSVRSYPFGSLAAHLLGYTGVISQEELSRFNEDEGRNIHYVFGDTVGKNGIEYQYESVLQGVRGSRIVHVDANGMVTGTVSEIPAEQGSDVHLTLDVNVQREAEAALADAYALSLTQHYHATGGAVVALNCKTGEVLAMASYPTFNPMAFIGGISTELWAQLQDPSAHTPLLNRAINGLYPTASTIKPFSCLAALECGVAGYETWYECTGLWTGLGDAYGMYCSNRKGHGYLTMDEAIAYSCDVVFYEIAKGIYYSSTPEALQDVFRRWGLGSATGIDLPGESKGRVPDAEWKWNWYTWAPDESRSWVPGDTANISIGQGDILATPLQIALGYCGLGMSGIEMRPRLLESIRSSQTGQTLSKAQNAQVRVAQVDFSHLDFVRQALRAVITDNDYVESFEGIPGSVGGKSGTGEAGDDPDNPHALFAAITPIEDPTYVAVALVEHGGYGAEVALDVCARTLKAIYGITS